MDYSLYTLEDLLTDENFIKYCLRKQSEDVVFWQNVLIQHPSLVSMSAEAEKIFFMLSVKLSPQEKASELLKLKQSIEQTDVLETVAPNYETKKIKLPGLHTWISAAAAILICIGIVSIISRKDGNITLPSYQEISKAETLRTGFNERRKVTLSDGSIVILNGLTELKIDASYNKDSRVLWLKGEAYFQVSKNKDKPFIVISGKTAITALGTSFKINNYTADHPVSIMLTTGKVSVGKVADQKIANKMELLPGEKADVTELSSEFVKTAFDPAEVENWKSRRLVFSMATLREIRTVLKTTYGVEIETDSQPKKPIAFTGQFTDQSLTDVLDAIGFSNHFSYSVNNNKVMLNFKK
ncbi:MAG TPA: FecR domain-containing protein [Pedobacter sp.]|nr:FecR domain-containing protein [Pedobacter sp.]